MHDMQTGRIDVAQGVWLTFFHISLTLECLIRRMCLGRDLYLDFGSGWHFIHTKKCCVTF